MQDAVPQKKTKLPHRAGYHAGIFFLKCGIGVVIVWAVLTWWVGIAVCHDNAAAPMVKDGDFCLFSRCAEPEVGDEVVYLQDGHRTFGRILAKSGETVEISDGVVLVNGYRIPEDIPFPTDADHANISFPYTVPENACFILHDNRQDSTDSRQYGAIPETAVQGTVIFLMRRRGI